MTRISSISFMTTLLAMISIVFGCRVMPAGQANQQKIMCHNILTNMARHPTETFLISLLATVSTVRGCGVMPAGQASTRPFTVTGLTTLPVAMVYSSAADIQARFPGIAPSEAAARGYVERLVTQTVFDVLERQGRSALLPDAVISAILGQLNVTISYTPLDCQMSAKPDEELAMMQRSVCIIVDNRVTGICTTKMQRKMCGKPEVNAVEVSAINNTHLTIRGSLMTTNIIMANWSRMMWQSVVDRAVRMLASGAFGSHFLSALVTVGGN